MGFNEQIPQEEQQSGLSWQCNNLVKSSNVKSSDEEEDDGTTCTIWKDPWVELTEKCGDLFQCDMNIYVKSATTREIFPEMMILLAVFKSDNKLNCPFGSLIMH